MRTVDVTVTTLSGTSATSSYDKFSYFTFTVTNTSALSTVTGSLPWAVAQANADTSGCPVTIDFATGPGQTFVTAQTITLSSTLNLVNTTPGESITIDGYGTSVTVSGGGSGSSFSVLSVAAGTTASVDDLTITKGYAAQGRDRQLGHTDPSGFLYQLQQGCRLRGTGCSRRRLLQRWLTDAT